MLDFSRSKVFSILAVCFVFLLLAFPNLLSESNRSKLPSFIPSRAVNLGLDLQGGSYLLLELQFDRYINEQLASSVDALRSAMIADKIMYRDLAQSGDVIKFTLLKNNSDKTIKDVVAKIDGELEVKNPNGDNYEVSFFKTALQAKKIRLIEQSMQIVNKRVNETGTREPIIQRQGENRIVLQVPGLHEPERLKALLGKTAKMTFHLLDENADPSDLVQGKAPIGSTIMYEEITGENGEVKNYPLAIKNRVMLSGDLLVDASVDYDQQTNKPVVAFRFNSEGARRFGEITRDNIGKHFAIVLDNKVITAPRILSAILGGSGIITGGFSAESANDLAVLLRSGALPVPLKVVEERSVGPSLGADSIAAGKNAALLAVAFVMGFMLINYGLFGIFANIALFVNLIFLIGALSLFQATLTLPGIAGIVLTLGMAVDANVLIYERIREEMRAGKTPFAAVEHGFRISKATILDANVTTLIATLFLYYFGTGTVKGFAVTLAIGILASMFTAILLTRLMVSVWLRRTRPKSIPI